MMQIWAYLYDVYCRWEHGMGNNKRFGAVIALGIAVLLIGSLYGGYKFITKLSPQVDSRFNQVAEDKLGIDIEAIREARRQEAEARKLAREKERQERAQNKESVKDTGKKEVPAEAKSILEEPYTYKSQNTRSYDGPRIMAVGTYIFNSEGKILKDLMDDDTDIYNVSLNVDASEGVICKEDELYYFDGNLNLTRIAGDVKSAGMCYEGGYFYYISDVEGAPYVLYIYDVSQKKAVRIDEINQNAVAISPDGQTVAYFKFDAVKGLYTCRAGERPILIADGSSMSALTVSNDGNTVFYDVYGKDDGSFCYNNGVSTRLCDKYIHISFFDRDCRQMLFEDQEAIKYYRAGDRAPSKLMDDAYFEYDISGTGYAETYIHSGKYIIDTDCFSDVLFINDYTNYYVLKGERPAMFRLNDEIEGIHSVRMTMEEGGPSLTYRLGSNLFKAKYNGDYITKKVLIDGEGRMSSGYAASEDLDEIWISFYGGSSIFYKKGDSEAEEIFLEGDKSTYDIRWNPLDGKCYYVINNELYCCGDGSSTPSLVASDVAWLSSAYSDLDLVCFSKNDEDKTDYCVIFDEILKLH